MALIDSSVWIGLLNQGDAHHTRAIGDLKALKKSNERILVTDYVVVEVSAVLMKRAGRTLLVEFLKLLENDESIDTVITGEDVLRSLVREYHRFARGLSFVDVSLIALSKGLGAKLLTYDEELKRSA